MIVALLVGVIFGLTGHYLFVAPSLLKQGKLIGTAQAALALRGWLNSLSAEQRQDIESNLRAYNLQLAVKAASVAAKDKK